MTIGEKIRNARIEKKLTQAEVASDRITRNMLSAIESGKAQPSLDTLTYIADKLDLPLYYLLSDEIGVSDFKKANELPKIKEAFSKKAYQSCITYARGIVDLDDEIAYILAYSHFELGVAAAKNGAFITAEKHLTLADEYAKKTIYDTASLEYKIPLYISIGRNVNAPLFDFDQDAFIAKMSQATDLEFYKYVCNDWKFPYTDPRLRLHAEAKMKIKERKYSEAIAILLKITDTRSDFEYNAYLTYGVYGDLDHCYKQLLDFENAYKYASKRLSMLEGFNS